MNESITRAAGMSNRNHTYASGLPRAFGFSFAPDIAMRGFLMSFLPYRREVSHSTEMSKSLERGGAWFGEEAF